MKKYSIFIKTGSLILLLNSCLLNAQGTWVSKTTGISKADYKGEFSFVIGTKAYLGGGRLSTGNTRNYCLQYDMVTDVWTQPALPYIAVSGAAGFSIGNCGYIVSGSDRLNLIGNVNEYNQSTNTWTVKSSFPGLFRDDAVAFSVGNKGYLGTGKTRNAYGPYSSLNDFWEYDATNDTWSQKANFSGAGR